MACGGIVRDPMKSEDGYIIQKYSLEIEKGIEATDLTGYLFSKYIIDMDDRQRIHACQPKVARANLLISIILCRGPNAFDGFLESLQDSGYKELYKKLKGVRSPTEGTSASREGNSKSSSDVLNELNKRVSAIEQILVDLVSRVQDSTSTLRSIKELSRSSKETHDTIDRLRLQLEEKDKLLNSANDELEDIKKKVSWLEDENNRLLKTVNTLEHQQWSDRQIAQKKFDKLEKKLRKMKRPGKKIKRKWKLHGRKIKKKWKQHEEKIKWKWRRPRRTSFRIF